MNILLTGMKGVGKTTVLNHVLQDFSGSMAGYVTYSGYIKENGLRDVYFKPFGASDIYDEAHRIIERIDPVQRRVFPEVFDETGAAILLDALESRPDIIVIDEIGTFEKRREVFKTVVVKCLDSAIPVLGVIRKAKSDFLDEIRSRPDVEIIEITVDNRDNIIPAINGKINTL